MFKKNDYTWEQVTKEQFRALMNSKEEPFYRALGKGEFSPEDFRFHTVGDFFPVLAEEVFLMERDTLLAICPDCSWLVYFKGTIIQKEEKEE